ncbi:MAG: hypothetical protein HY303_11420 [Candidatus Wallbacteria bacterium]|nr:hypothetical protein [Candidatus Wallbacteria bacterium]
MKFLKVSLALAGLLAWTAASPLPALDIDHEHGVTEHHGGEIGQASRPSTGHAFGKAGLDRVNHRHFVFPECEHAGHHEVIDDCHTCFKDTSDCGHACKGELRSHRTAAEVADTIADRRDCCDEVFVDVPRGYPGLSGYNYWSTGEVQMDYAFHHLTGAQLASERQALEKDGVIPTGLGKPNPRLDAILQSLKDAGIDPRISEKAQAPAADDKKADDKPTASKD